MKKGQKTPYYGNRTKQQIIKAYFTSSSSMDELSSLYGVLGSNTVGSWLRKYRHLRPPKALNAEIMDKPHSPIEEKNQRKKKYKTNEQLYISQLEADLERAQQRVQFYTHALHIINDLAKELTGIDLLKKTGQELSRRSTKQES